MRIRLVKGTDFGGGLAYSFSPLSGAFQQLDTELKGSGMMGTPGEETVGWPRAHWDPRVGACVGPGSGDQDQPEKDGRGR